MIDLHNSTQTPAFQKQMQFGFSLRKKRKQIERNITPGASLI